MSNMWKWNSKLETGVETVDQQHKKLINQVNKLVTSHKDNSKNDISLKTLQFLKKYIVEHFIDEENIQRMTGYPKYEEHKQLHEEFRKNIEVLLNNNSGNEVTTVEFFELCRTLNEWLVEHIGMADTDFADYLKENNIT